VRWQSVLFDCQKRVSLIWRNAGPASHTHYVSFFSIAPEFPSMESFTPIMKRLRGMMPRGLARSYSKRSKLTN
jgi:hypothetical protein